MGEYEPFGWRIVMPMPSIALHVFKIYCEHVKLAAALSHLLHLLVLQ